MKKITIGSKPTAKSAPSSPDEWVRSKQGAAEPTKRLTIDISFTLHARVKSQCALQNLQMADVIREMLDHRFPDEATRDDPRQPAMDETTETQKPVEP